VREVVPDTALLVVQVGVAHPARLNRDQRLARAGFGHENRRNLHRLALAAGQHALNADCHRSAFLSSPASSWFTRGRECYLRRYSPRATMTADPPTRTRSTLSAEPSARAYSRDGRPISSPWRISISSPKPIRPCRARCTASGPAAEPVRGSSGTPWCGENIRVFQAVPRPAKVLTAIGRWPSARWSGL